MKKVVIDSGHGGADPGSSGNGIIEKEYTLKISQYIYDFSAFHNSNFASNFRSIFHF